MDMVMERKTNTNIVYTRLYSCGCQVKIKVVETFSNTIPMGQYLAGSHHLKILVDTFAKDQHGIRQQDLNHNDKQNFDAVTRITSSSVLTLLEKFPDAKG